MISPKLAVLMATMAFVGTGLAFTPAVNTAFAQEADVEVERNNEIDQEIKQEQEACTNEGKAKVSDDDFVDILGGDNTATVDQSNTCLVVQTQEAANTAAIVDASTNDINAEALAALVDLDFF
jgi:hypothetical protein